MIDRVVLVGIVIAFVGCKSSDANDCKNSRQARHVEEVSREADQRILAAMNAGLDDLRGRMVAAGKPIEQAIAEGMLPADKDIPTSPRAKDGSLHPIVQKFAIDGNGKLRGEGPSMDVLQQEMRLALDALDAARKNGCPE